jgi:hypothetical protein
MAGVMAVHLFPHALLETEFKMASGIAQRTISAGSGGGKKNADRSERW